MHNQTESVTTIMAVDDTPANLQLLEGMLLEKNYRVLSFPRGDLALKTAQNNLPDLLLLDINMPEMDGYEVCRRFKEDSKLHNVPIIFISGYNDTEDRVKAFNMGGVDYITKPFQIEEVHARVETHLKVHRMLWELNKHNHSLEEQVKAKVHEISSSQMATIFAMAKLSESRDDDTGNHLERVQAYCLSLATKLAKDSAYQQEVTPSFLENIYLASPFHDIGKVTIPDAILLKPGKHTAEEFETMKTHTLTGAKTLASILAKYPRNSFIRTGLTIARSHHERWDGTGYPDNAKGLEITLYARIMAIADVYDALRSDRCYRKGISHEEACTMILEGSGTQFDPEIVIAFKAVSDDFLRISIEKTDTLSPEENP